jgi:hypothetical protein
MATVNLLPSSDVSGNQNFDLVGGTAAYANLEDGGDTRGVQASDQNKYCVVELDNYTAGGTVDSIRWYVRGAYRFIRSGDTDVQVVLALGDHAPVTGSANAHYSETFTLTFNGGYAPQDYYGTARTTDVGGNPWVALTLNDLRLDINTTPEAPDTPGGPTQQATIWQAWVEVTYTAAAVTDNATFFGANF